VSGLLDDIVLPDSPIDLDALEHEYTPKRNDIGDDRVVALIAELRAYRVSEAEDRADLKRVMSVEYRNTGNGYARAFKHVCAGCGREFDSNRRQLPGKRMWCGRAECKKQAAAERARDYRARKHEGEMP
jgi:hypothetical protein